MAEQITDPEVKAMRDAYIAISSRPFEDRSRMIKWLCDRLEYDEQKHLAAKAAQAKSKNGN